ncbi:alpha carbonic anhydrase [Cladochytrium replicatum]|nr:alpha carbonic anhydrase [Cladochytrium replicatum]
MLVRDSSLIALLLILSPIFCAHVASAYQENCLADVIRAVDARLHKRADASGWSYNGATGPADWPGTCQTGTQQSPINIVGESILSPQAPLEFHWSSTLSSVNYTNNGHTVVATVPKDDSSYVLKNNIKYKLLQFHFHNPSEHRFEDFATALEAHFVHASDAGELLVVGVLLDPNPKIAVQSTSPEFKKGFLDVVSDEYKIPKKGGSVLIGTAECPLSLNSVVGLFGGDLESEFHVYNGSLTTPPCTEGVRWHVYKNVVGIPTDKLYPIQKVLPFSSRETQPWGGRLGISEAGFSNSTASSHLSASSADAMNVVSSSEAGFNMATVVISTVGAFVGGVAVAVIGAVLWKRKGHAHESVKTEVVAP